MAIFTPSPIIGEIRKKIGSDVFSKNHYGPIIRKRVKPINPRSAGQTTQRSLLKSLSHSWKSLTQDQILGWNALGPQIVKKNSLGLPKKLTGEAMYISCNLNIVASGNNQIADAPSVGSNDVVNVSDIVVSQASGAISMAYSPSPLGKFTGIVRASKPLSGGKSYNSQFKTIESFDSTKLGPLDLTDAYVAVYGAVPAVGEVAFFEVSTVGNLTGFRTLSTSFRMVAGA